MSNAAVIITVAGGVVTAVLAVAAAITGLAAKARAEQNGLQVVELREALEFERHERQVERRKCEQDIASIRAQLEAAVAAATTAAAVVAVRTRRARAAAVVAADRHGPTPQRPTCHTPRATRLATVK